MPKTTKEIIEEHINHPTGLSYTEYKTKRWWSEEEILELLDKHVFNYGSYRCNIADADAFRKDLQKELTTI